jgi:YesN/AraC family two-component response regulator
MADDKKRMIMCVDDEPDVATSLYDTFMDFYDVKTANSGKDALKIFNEEDISLVISDQRMPEMEGTELFAEIHKIKPICKKILLTGYADVNAAIDAINLGAVDKYYSKPWDDEELIKEVAALIEELGMDEFFDNVIKEQKGMVDNLGQLKTDSGLFSKFLDNYATGVCLLGTDESIQYLNKSGMSSLKCNDLKDVQGKALDEVFPITAVNREKLIQKSMKKDMSPSSMSVKLCDGTSKDLQVNVIFASGESGIKVCGIVFQK